MSLASETADEIRAAIATSEQAHSFIESLRGHVDAMQQELQQWTDGSSDPRPVEAVVRLQQARVRLDEAEVEFTRAEEALKDYITELLGSSGDGAVTVSMTVASPSDSETRRNSTEAGKPKFDTNRPDRGIVERIRKLGWPRNDRGNIQARALFFDKDGTEVFNRPLQALPKGSTYRTPDLRDEYRSEDLTISWHVEGGIAAFLRKNPDIKSAALYINTPPCGRSPLDETRCHTNLRKILPEGTTLTVWIVRERGLPQKRIFEGTGEAIK